MVEAQVVLVEQPQVFDVVFEQRHPLDPEAPGIAGVLLGVDATIAENLGMDHTATAGLKPAGVAAAPAALAEAAAAHRVELEARLRVAEVMRPHPNLALGAEERLGHVE